MKKFLVIILLVISIKGHSQFYLNYNEEMVNSVLDKEPGLNSRERLVLNSGETVLQWDNPSGKYHGAVYFNTNGTSYMFSLIPHNSTAFNKWVEYFNKNYVTISDKEWKIYHGDDVYKILIMFNAGLNKNVICYSISKN